MAHAQQCPVCGGSGKVKEKICHGCDGRGWVEVSDTYPWPRPRPKPLRPWDDDPHTWYRW